MWFFTWSFKVHIVWEGHKFLPNLHRSSVKCTVEISQNFVAFSKYMSFNQVHSGFLEHWNSQKSVCNIWQRFSCLLDEEIPKIWKKLNSHGGFLRADQGRAKMCCQMGWIGCAILQVAQKAIVRIQFLAYFWNPLIK